MMRTGGDIDVLHGIGVLCRLWGIPSMVDLDLRHSSNRLRLIFLRHGGKVHMLNSGLIGCKPCEPTDGLPVRPRLVHIRKFSYCGCWGFLRWRRRARRIEDMLLRGSVAKDFPGYWSGATVVGLSLAQLGSTLDRTEKHATVTRRYRRSDSSWCWRSGRRTGRGRRRGRGTHGG